MVAKLIAVWVVPAVVTGFSGQDRCGVPREPMPRTGLVSYVQAGLGVGAIVLDNAPDRPSFTLRTSEMWFKTGSLRFGLTQALRVAPDRELLLGGRLAWVPGIAEFAGEAHYGFHLGGDALPDEEQVYLGGAVGLELLTTGGLRVRGLAPLEEGGPTFELEVSVRPRFLARVLSGRAQPATKTPFEDPQGSWLAVGGILNQLGIEFDTLSEAHRASVYRIVCEGADRHEKTTQFLISVGEDVKQIQGCADCGRAAEAISRLAATSAFVTLPVECVAYAIEASLYLALSRAAFAHRCEGF
jgi:hypothetical protein